MVSATLFVTHCIIGVATSLSLNHQHHHLSTNNFIDPLHDHHDDGVAAVVISRRDVLRRTAATATATSSTAAVSILASQPLPCCSADDTTTTTTAGLARRLSMRDPSQLKNSVFNIPPKAQVYPEFLRGQWDVTMKFRGFLFPSTSIPKDKLVSNVSIPGFEKLSIAQVADVGREQLTTYTMSINPATGLEDRSVSIASSINAHLGYDAVRQVLYDPQDNPNRISIDFIPNRTRNANRIELFCNHRESELVVLSNPPTTTTTTTTAYDTSTFSGHASPTSKIAISSSQSTQTIFVCSEYIRQVTFGLSQEFGVARQVVGNYAHFWTWKENNENNNNDDEQSKSSTNVVVTGNLLTAAYLDAQDALFFEEPSKPVVVYSHDLVAKKKQ